MSITKTLTKAEIAAAAVKLLQVHPIPNKPDEFILPTPTEWKEIKETFKANKGDERILEVAEGIYARSYAEISQSIKENCKDVTEIQESTGTTHSIPS